MCDELFSFTFSFNVKVYITLHRGVRLKFQYLNINGSLKKIPMSAASMRR